MFSLPSAQPFVKTPSILKHLIKQMGGEKKLLLKFRHPVSSIRFFQ